MAVVRRGPNLIRGSNLVRVTLRGNRDRFVAVTLQQQYGLGGLPVVPKKLPFGMKWQGKSQLHLTREYTIQISIDPNQT